MFHGHTTLLAIVAAALLGLVAGVMLVGQAGNPAASGQPSTSVQAGGGSAPPSATSVATPTQPAQPLTQEYIFTDLGVLTGLDSMAFGVGGGGEGIFGATFVVGHADTAPNSKWTGFHAFLWVDSAGRMFDIGTLRGDAKSNANDVSSRGIVVGESLGAEITRAFLYDGKMHDLGGFGGTNTGALAVNDIGQVAGYSKIKAGADHAFLWTPAAGTFAHGTMIDLGTLPGDVASHAQGINSRGQVVGYSNDPSYYSHAFLWTPSTENGAAGSMTSLGALPGEEYASAYAVNESGAVVGEAQVGDGFHAFLWQPTSPNGTTGAMTDLGTFGGNWSRATAINKAGDVVGVAEGPAPDSFDYAFLWRNGTLYDLNTVLPADLDGVVLTTAYGISDSGQIVGGATINEHSHAFLLTPRN
jgi:probable HAF family extracellular repeat protein